MQTLLVCMGLFLTNILYHKLASHFLPRLVLIQIAITTPTTDITANKVINASISYIFIILYPIYEKIYVTNIPINISNQYSSLSCCVATETILPTTNAVKDILAKS